MSVGVLVCFCGSFVVFDRLNAFVLVGILLTIFCSLLAREAKVGRSSSAGLLSTMLYTANKPLIGCSQSSPNKGNLLRRVFDYMSIKKCFI